MRAFRMKVYVSRSKHIMDLFRKAIGGNEEILVQNLEVDSGLWTALQTRKVLNDHQLANCRREVS